MGPEEVFVLIGPCLEPDESTPRTDPLLSPTPASLKLCIPFKFLEIPCESKFQVFGDVLCR